jgi:hypothetical protein
MKHPHNRSRTKMLGLAACALFPASMSFASAYGDRGAYGPHGPTWSPRCPPGARCRNPELRLPASGQRLFMDLLRARATLLDPHKQQIITHLLSPNPVEGGTPRATWPSSKDTSAVWAMPIASSSDPAFVASNSIPWLLLRVVGQRPGPTGGRSLFRLHSTSQHAGRGRSQPRLHPGLRCGVEDAGPL